MNQAIKTHFDHFSSAYRKSFLDKKSGKNYEFRTRLKLIEGLVAGTAGNLLDCACGTGEITLAALKSGRFDSAVVADISNEMLVFAKQHIMAASLSVDIQYKQIDIFEYKPDDGQHFDIIMCLGLIAHSGHLTELLSHLRLMLAPGGRILLQSSLADHLGVQFIRLLTNKRYSRRQNYNLSYFKISDIEQSTHDSGMRISEMKHYCLGFPFGDRLFPLGNYWLEVAAQRFSAKLGSEAIFVLCP